MGVRVGYRLFKDL